MRGRSRRPRPEGQPEQRRICTSGPRRPAAKASAVEPKSLYASRRPGTHLAAFSSVDIPRTRGELAAVMHDLPDESTVDAALDHREGARQLIVAFLVAMLVLALLGAAVAAFR
jgi:hypothetical protein